MIFKNHLKPNSFINLIDLIQSVLIKKQQQ